MRGGKPTWSGVGASPTKQLGLVFTGADMPVVCQSDPASISPMDPMDADAVELVDVTLPVGHHLQQALLPVGALLHVLHTAEAGNLVVVDGGGDEKEVLGEEGDGACASEEGWKSGSCLARRRTAEMASSTAVASPSEEAPKLIRGEPADPPPVGASSPAPLLQLPSPPPQRPFSYPVPPCWPPCSPWSSSSDQPPPPAVAATAEGGRRLWVGIHRRPLAHSLSGLSLFPSGWEFAC